MALSKRRATALFVLGYLAVTVVGMVTYVLAATLLGIPLSESLSFDHKATHSLRATPGYPEAQRFFPLANLIVWLFFAWWYFKGKRLLSIRDALPLAARWAIAAVLLDLVASVVLPELLGHPAWLEWYATTPYSFYVEQAPWIYLIYLAIFLAPLLYARLRALRAR